MDYFRKDLLVSFFISHIFNIRNTISLIYLPILDSYLHLSGTLTVVYKKNTSQAL